MIRGNLIIGGALGKKLLCLREVRDRLIGAFTGQAQGDATGAFHRSALGQRSKASFLRGKRKKTGWQTFPEEKKTIRIPKGSTTCRALPWDKVLQKKKKRGNCV